MATSVSEYDATHYVHRLDLGDDPFASDFVSDYFYCPAERRQLLDQLVHFGRFGNQVVMLVGATGSGTSTVLDQAIIQLREVMDCCYVDAEVVTTPEQLKQSLCEQLQFNLDMPVSNSDFFASLQAEFNVDYDIEPVLLAVDQAHFLSLEGFELLRAILDSSNDMLNLLLVGEYQIEQLAGLAQFDTGHIKQLQLAPLSQSETGEFLQGLLQAAGYARELPFNSDQLTVLYEQSRGNIVEIKQLAPALLSVKPPLEGTSSRFGIPVVHVAVIAVLVVALVLAWLLQEGDQPPPLAGPQPGKDVVPSVMVPEPAGHDGPVVAGAISRDLPAAVVQPPSSPPSPAAEPAKSPATAPSSPLTPPQQAVTDRQTRPEAQPVPEPSPPPAVVKAAPKQAPPKPVAVKTPRPEPAAPASVELSAAEKRLLTLPASSYVVQLLGAVDEQRTRAFIKRYAGRLPVSYFATTRNGKPWYVAIAGPYDSKAAAVEKIASLPAELQKQRPWTRSIASVQQDIRAKQQ